MSSSSPDLRPPPAGLLVIEPYAEADIFNLQLQIHTCWCALPYRAEIDRVSKSWIKSIVSLMGTPCRARSANPTEGNTDRRPSLPFLDACSYKEPFSSGLSAFHPIFSHKILPFFKARKERTGFLAQTECRRTKSSNPKGSLVRPNCCSFAS